MNIMLLQVVILFSLIFSDNNGYDIEYSVRSKNLLYLLRQRLELYV